MWAKSPTFLIPCWWSVNYRVGKKIPSCIMIVSSINLNTYEGRTAMDRELRKIPQESTLCSEPNYLLCAYIKLEICCQEREETRSVQQTERLIKQGCRRTHLRSLTPFFFAFTNTIVYSLRKTCQHDSLQMCFGNQHDSLHYPNSFSLFFKLRIPADLCSLPKVRGR